MLDTACNFALTSAFNAKYDITWSFQFSLCGVPGSTGGFTTFLYDANTPMLTGGGVRSGLAYGPYIITDNLLIAPAGTDKLSIAAPAFNGFIRVSDGDITGEPYQNGLSGAMLGVGFDSTGLFGTQQRGFVTGLSAALHNSYSVRATTNYTHISTYAAPFNILETYETFRTLRFNLTNLGQTLNIHMYDYPTRTYNLISSTPTGLLFIEDTMCKIGLSFATPVSASYKSNFKIKDFHFQGRS